MIPVGLELAVGIGLLFHRRWGWVLGIGTSIFFVEEGLRLVLTDGYMLLAWTIYYFIPATVLLVCLLPRRARRAYLGEKQFDVN
jgi:hypothetical protein